MDSEEKKSGAFWKDLIKLLLLAVFVVVPFRLYVAQPFIVDGASMDPTFKTGQYLIVDEMTYRFKEPERGSVVIFKYPRDPKKFFIKRIIGLPGETVVIRNGQVTIINDEFSQGLLLDEPYVKYQKKDNLSFTLVSGEYFVMGDNRLGSADSRLWGAITDRHIIGRPVVRFYPPTLLPGDMSTVYETEENE